MKREERRNKMYQQRKTVACKNLSWITSCGFASICLSVMLMPVNSFNAASIPSLGSTDTSCSRVPRAGHVSM